MDDLYPAEVYLDFPELLGPELSPNGERVAFLWNDTGRRELYVAPTDGCEEPKQLTDRDLRGLAFGSDYCWEADSNGLYALRFPRDNPALGSIGAVSLDGTWSTLFEVDDLTIPWTVTADGSLIYGTHGDGTLSLYNPTTKERRPIVNESFQNYNNVCVSPDSQYVAFAAFNPDGEFSFGSFVARISSKASPTPVVEEPEGKILPVGWRPTENQLLIHDYAEDRYGVYEPQPSTVEWIIEAPQTAFGLDLQDKDRPVGFLPDGDGILVVPDGDPVIMNADTCLDITLPPVQQADIQDGHLAFVTDGTDDEAPRLVTLSNSTASTTPILETTYGPISPNDDVTAEEHSYESSAGDAKLLVYRPTEEPAPAIVHTYPRERIDEESQPRWLQYFVHRGYVVVRPSIPDPHTEDGHDNLATVGSWLREKQWVDGNRVAVYGHSGGGWQTLIQLFTRDVWDAGVARAPTTDDLPDTIETLEAPLRIHHPVHDTLTPVTQIREVRNRLRDAGYTEGADFEYEEILDQWHETADIAQQTDELTRVVDFFYRRL